MTNTKFIVGDVVEVANTEINRKSITFKARIYHHLTVEKVTALGSVRFRELRGTWGAERFNLVRRASEPANTDEVKIGRYIIALCRNGTLMPAAEPREYSSDVQAHRVAEQMAKKHGGTFVVLKGIGEYVMPEEVKPTYRAL